MVSSIYSCNIVQSNWNNANDIRDSSHLILSVLLSYPIMIVFLFNYLIFILFWYSPSEIVGITLGEELSEIIPVENTR